MDTKIALVTGGSRGLGKDMALSLAQKGIDVILTYNQYQAEAEKVVEEIHSFGRKAVTLQFDSSKLHQFDQFISKVTETLQSNWGTSKIDFLINNAGIGATLPIPEVTEEAFDHLVNTNFKGVYFLTQKALSIMNDNGGVIFISSGTTRFCAPGYSIYSSLKAAIEVFCRYVAKEYGPRGIRANTVAPGPIETDFNTAIIRNNPQIKLHLTNQTALGRVGNPDDVGSVVAFLCTDDAKWINAQRIEVSGGINL